MRLIPQLYGFIDEYNGAVAKSISVKLTLFAVNNDGAWDRPARSPALRRPFPIAAVAHTA